MSEQNKYLTNLPKITEYEERTEQAKAELFSFMIELRQKHQLTPSQTMFLMTDYVRFIANNCMNAENKEL